MRYTPSQPLTALHQRIISTTADMAAFDGWTDKALRAACEAEEVDFAIGEALFVNRPLDLILAHSSWGDAQLVAALSGQEWFETQRVRDKIKTLVMTRFDQHNHQREAIRRAMPILALPMYAPAASKALYRTVDTMWTLAGDTATDYNRYTKRALLSGVYSSSLLVWLNDKSEDGAKTDAFVTRRIDDVLRSFGQIGKITRGAAALRTRLFSGHNPA